MEKLKREPVLVKEVVVSILALVAAFGFELDPEVLGIGFTVLAMTTGIDVRRKVTPVADPRL